MNPAVLIILLLIAQASPLVSVTTDRTWYAPGEQVQITITVGNMDAPWLWLYIDRPDTHNVFFAKLRSRSQTVTWNIPLDAPEGTYTVTLTWDHRYIQTGFTVEGRPIPEFPVASLVLIVATIAFLAISRRQAGARSETLASHS